MAFSEQLIRARKLAGMSQLQLSQRSGVSQQAISKLEKGKSSPSTYTLTQLAAALHLPASVLIEENKNEPAVSDSELKREATIERLKNYPEPILLKILDLVDAVQDYRESGLADPVPGQSSGEHAP